MPPDPEPPDLPPLATDAVVADAVGAHATESPGHGRPVHPHCENCGTVLAGPYCHRCGQHDIDFQRSFGHMFLDALENFFHFDAKLFRNIVTLLFRPGRLTAEFNAGKRAAQVPPLRFYIFISVLFFFVRFLSAPPPAEIMDQAAKAEAQAGLAEALKAAAAETDDPRARQALQRLQAEGKPPAGRTKDAGKGPGLHLRVQDRQGTELERYLVEKSEYAIAHQLELKEAFLHALPKMLLFCLPFFALYLRGLFRTSGYAYLQQLIVALHFHTFVYLWWIVAHGWGALAGLLSPGLAGFAGFLGDTWMFLYPFLMLRRLFAKSWPRTILRTLVLAGIYGFTLGLGFVLTAIVVFLLA